MTAVSDPVSMPDSPSPRVVRIEVRANEGQPDAAADRVLAEARAALGARLSIRSAAVFLIEAPIDDAVADRIATELLADPVSQHAQIGIAAAAEGSRTIEVHYKPGVMDPVAQSAREAIIEMMPALSIDAVEVLTGTRYDIAGTEASTDDLTRFAAGHMANPVIQDIYAESFLPDAFPHGSPYTMQVSHVAMRDLDDDALVRMSRDAHLFLSLDEMRAVRDYYREAGREPTDIELETLAQTWSEHCVHKTLKSTIRYTPGNGDSAQGPIHWQSRPGHTVNDDGSITIENLLKTTIAAATFKLMEDADLGDDDTGWCVSVFEDNAGIVRFDDEDAVCIKVETHNHPSAIEPYGGAATGIGGCIRDVMGTGLAAWPIANTDVFAVARADAQRDMPAGVIEPRRVLQQVVAGVRDYGNRMGIPTVSGAVAFHENYLANPLVFAGCVGIMPLDKCFGSARPGDRIIALGGRTGRDGIHGATFSSAELTDTHADEFSHAVQIGNAITQKKTLDVIMQARDHERGCLFSAITDCGAGGFSSAVGEMGEKVGAYVTLDTAPLKYAGLSYTEIWISEAQERMVLAVPEQHVETLQALCDAEDVELCDLGRFGETTYGPDKGEPMLVLTYRGREVGRLAMALLHDGIPTPTREASWGTPGSVRDTPRSETTHAPAPAIDTTLTALLSHPNIASKQRIIRQYDHEVQGSSSVKPLTGPMQDGPSDASVVRPKPRSNRGLAIACGLQTGLGEDAVTAGVGDSYWMTLAAIDEVVRNLVCVGADPSRIAILDNFCWPSCGEPSNLGSLVRAAEACHDGALAYRTPFVSGKDSLNNQFTTEDGRLIAIPPTLLISGMGIVPDVTRCRTMDAKQPGNLLLLVGETTTALGGSHYTMVTGDASRTALPTTDLAVGPRNASAVAALIAQGLIASAHDCSDGGLLVAAAEMAFAGRIGLDVDLAGVPAQGTLDATAACFAETPSRYLLEITPANVDRVAHTLREAGVPFGQVGTLADHDRLTVRSPDQGRIVNASLDDLRSAWLRPLDW